MYIYIYIYVSKGTAVFRTTIQDLKDYLQASFVYEGDIPKYAGIPRRLCLKGSWHGNYHYGSWPCEKVAAFVCASNAFCFAESSEAWKVLYIYIYI